MKKLIMVSACYAVSVALCLGDGAGEEKEIVVKAIPIAGNSLNAGRLTDRIDFREGQGGCVADLLESSSIVSSFQRGAGDVQSDLSMRGSTFQQVLLALEGLPLTDIQTAHHNMDLPFPAEALGYADVIPGAGTALLGPAAFAGALDLRLHRPEKTELLVKGSGGTFNTWRTLVMQDYVEGNVAVNAGAAKTQSGGFMEGTDYEVWSGWGSVFAEYELLDLRVSAGHVEKDFGAQDFYASYPSRELTAATIVDIEPSLEVAEDWFVNTVLRYRRHEDDFILFRDNPARYRNLHESETYSARCTLFGRISGSGQVAAGFEYQDARLDSSSLGDRDTRVSSVFSEYRLAVGSCSLDIGLRADDSSDWGTELSPSFGVSGRIGENITVFASAARGIRAPSFTELYYNDPRNSGSPDLVPEEAWSFEAGADVRLSEYLALQLSVFRRDTDSVIDWTRALASDPWQADNIGEVNFEGGFLGLEYRRQSWYSGVSVQLVDADAADSGLESKYALNIAELDAAFYAGVRPFEGFDASVNVRRRNVKSLDDYTLAGISLSRTDGMITLFASASNLLDEDYQEIPGVPVAGTGIEAGAALRW